MSESEKENTIGLSRITSIIASSPSPYGKIPKRAGSPGVRLPPLKGKPLRPSIAPIKPNSDSLTRTGEVKRLKLHEQNLERKTTDGSLKVDISKNESHPSENIKKPLISGIISIPKLTRTESSKQNRERRTMDSNLKVDISKNKQSHPKDNIKKPLVPVRNNFNSKINTNEIV